MPNKDNGLFQLLVSLQEYIKQVSHHQLTSDTMLLEVINTLADKILVLEEKVKLLEQGKKSYDRSIN